MQQDDVNRWGDDQGGQLGGGDTGNEGPAQEKL